MGVIGAVIIGALAGWIASIIMKTNENMGAIANIIVGIIGGSIGGAIVEFLGFSKDGGLIWSILVGVLGACILIAIIQFITKRRAS